MTTDSTEIAKLRTEFEKLASDPTYKFARSPKGTYRNPALARDWKWFKLGKAQADAEAAEVNKMWNAVINFCIDKHSYDTVEILRLWREGCFPEIRESWPDAPEEMFP